MDKPKNVYQAIEAMPKDKEEEPVTKITLT